MARLAQRMAARPGAGRQSAAKEEAEKERRRKNNRLCVAMVVIFGICWLPLNGINFIADINVVDIFCWRFYHFTFFLCHILAMSSNCYNPFLYAWLNDAFRQEFVKMLPFLASLCGPTTGDQTANGAAIHGRRKVTRATTIGGNADPEKVNVPLISKIKTRSLDETKKNSLVRAATENVGEIEAERV